MPLEEKLYAISGRTDVLVIVFQKSDVPSFEEDYRSLMIVSNISFESKDIPLKRD